MTKEHVRFEKDRWEWAHPGLATHQLRERELLSTGRVFDWLGDWTVAALPGSPAVYHIGAGECILFHNTHADSRFRVWFRRGFLESLTTTAADCLAHLDAVLAAHPVTEVRLTTRPNRDGMEFVASAGFSGEDGYRIPGRPTVHTVRSILEESQNPDRGAFWLGLWRLEWPAVKTWHMPEPR
jgi:hypothetical protein